MTTLRYVSGDATAPIGDGDKVVVHVCNDRGWWGRGFVMALSRRWAAPERAYRAWAASGTLELGMIQLVVVDANVRVVNLVAQSGYTSTANPVAIRYDALAKGLAKLAGAIDATTSIHLPRIGAGLGGGDWAVIERILQDELCARGLDVTVYTWPATAKSVGLGSAEHTGQ